MSKLPAEIKLTHHAQLRLEERNNSDYVYNTKNLMKSSCKWYSKGDLIYDNALYRHCCYTCRKSNRLGYITDGNIEVIYNKNTKTAVTILEVKDKFKPITQYIKPEILKQIEKKKENKKMKKIKREVGTCPDCGSENVELRVEGIYKGLCDSCKMRRQNAKAKKKDYIPYLQLSAREKDKIRILQAAQQKAAKEKLDKKQMMIKEIPLPEIQIAENYYQVKAEQNPAIAQMHPSSVDNDNKMISKSDSLASSQNDFITTLRNCGCEIPEENLNELLSVLLATNQLKDMIINITKDDNQQAMLDLEQALNVVERKLQHDWEFNGFQEADDIRFKGFLTWRRILKGAIYFWKKLYQTNTLLEMQRAWNAYTQDPTEKLTLVGDKITSIMKRYQITTDSISTIYNTRRPFTRVFYASSKEEAYKQFVQWMSERQLHEDKSKTTIVELKPAGEDGRDDEIKQKRV